jgi:hypothetical protein
MAKKKRRSNEARLKVIAGGAGPKAVVAKPARQAKPAETSTRRAANAARLPPVEETAYDRVSAVEPTPARPAVPAFPRWVVPVGIAAVVGVIAWALLSKSTNPATPAAIPPPTAFSTTAWPSQPAPVVSTEPVVTATVAPSISMSAPLASSSAPSAPSAAPSAVPSATISAPSAAPSAAPTAAPKPKAAAPKPPPPPNDDPYQ